MTEMKRHGEAGSKLMCREASMVPAYSLLLFGGELQVGTYCCMCLHRGLGEDERGGECGGGTACVCMCVWGGGAGGVHACVCVCVW